MHKQTNTTNFRQSLGRMGESIACQILMDSGWTIVKRNFRAHRLGEIDIIGRPPEGGVLAFIEVKTRDIKSAGGGFDHTGQLSVHPAKVRRLIKAALAFMRQHPEEQGSLRFDLILVDIGLNRADLHELVELGDWKALAGRAEVVHMPAIAGRF